MSTEPNMRNLIRDPLFIFYQVLQITDLFGTVVAILVRKNYAN
jgi:hypothetical protein